MPKSISHIFRNPALRLAGATFLVLAVLVLGPHSTAQDPEPETQPSPSRSGAGAEEQLETFVPTEKVPVGSAVAFPVDI
ncbi:MAG: hypothetical protein MI919_30435 [Holophagales bacterium]|nr:hypothetical protein [Holophagales bacterium]